MKPFCQLPWSRAKIESDGLVRMCCHQKEYLGNLFENTFDELWFGKKANEIRKSILNGRLETSCNTTECPYNYYAKHQCDNQSVDYPQEIEFDLHPTMCNYGGTKIDENKTCIMCPRIAYKEKYVNIPDNTNLILDKISHLIPYLNSISVLGLAEPFWRDGLFHVFDKLNFKKNRHKISFWTHTNGSIFDKNKMIKFSEYVQKSSLSFSLDAATSQTYKLIRKHDWTPVLKNLRDWVEMSSELNLHGNEHKVVIFNNINTLNVDEVEQMVQLTYDLGVKYLTLIPTTDCGGDNKLISNIMPSNKNWQKFAKAEVLAKALAKDLNINLIFVRPLDLGMSNRLTIL